MPASWCGRWRTGHVAGRNHRGASSATGTPTIEESELSLSTQKGLRVSLIRRFFSESLDFINVAKNFIEVKDFYDLLGKIIFPPRCHGKLGGKSAGLFLAKKIIDKAPDAQLASARGEGAEDLVHHLRLDSAFRSPQRIWRTFSTGSTWRSTRSGRNIRTWWRCSRVRRFPSEFAKGLSLALDDLGDRPSDRPQLEPAGRPRGLGVLRQVQEPVSGQPGTKEERLAALMDAIAEVYASIFGPDPTEYRAERGLLDVHEEMGIMIQEVVGPAVGKYFLPACSGVAFSNNEFRWSARIKREDGLIRLVPGLGTRAVDRVADDYPVLIAPGQPNLRVNVTAGRSAQVLAQARRRHQPGDERVRDRRRRRNSCAIAGADYPQIRNLVSLVEPRPDRAADRTDADFSSQDAVFTFEGLIRKTPFVSCIRELLTCCKPSSARPWISSSPTTARISICCSAGRRATAATRCRSRSRRTCRPTSHLFGEPFCLERQGAGHHAHRLCRPRGLQPATRSDGHARCRTRGRQAEQAVAEAPVHPDRPRTLGQSRRHQARRSGDLLRHQQHARC